MKKLKVILILAGVLPVLKAILFPVFFVSVGTTFMLSSCCDTCDNPPIDTFAATPYEWPTPAGNKPWFPTLMNIPSDNPMTVEGVELGRYLFYDTRLSGRQPCEMQMSCATCHIQEHSFEVGIDNPRFPDGVTRGLPDDQYPEGKPTPHFNMPFINLVFNMNGYLWNGMIHSSNPNLGNAAYGVPAEPQYHLRNIESLVWMGIHAQHEINGTVDMTVNMIKTITKNPDYPKLFKAAYGTEEINYDRISKAIAQFIRSLISYNSKYHKWIRKEIPNLTPAEYRGYTLFMSEKGDCFHCHGNPVFLTTNLFYNNGLDTLFNDPRDHFGFTKNPMDKGAYKAPTLINCELTAPYMRDGRFKTLEEVISHYSEGVQYSAYINPLMKWASHGGNQLTETEKADLLAFLKTLTDYDFITNPAYSRPADLKTGCE